MGKKSECYTLSPLGNKKVKNSVPATLFIPFIEGKITKIVNIYPDPYELSCDKFLHHTKPTCLTQQCAYMCQLTSFPLSDTISCLACSPRSWFLHTMCTVAPVQYYTIIIVASTVYINYVFG